MSQPGPWGNAWALAVACAGIGAALGALFGQYALGGLLGLGAGLLVILVKTLSDVA